MASSTTFLLNVLLARWLVPLDYGAYSVCWSVLLVLAGFHNALVLEPMSVVGPASYGSNLPGYLQTNARLNWAVMLLLAAIAPVVAFFYNQSAVQSALWVLTICVPGYFLLLVARRAQYVLNQPAAALRFSVPYALIVALVIATARLTNHLSVSVALASFGLAGFVGLSFKSTSRGDRVPMSALIRHHWRYGKWLFASSLLAMGALELQTILLSMLVDLKSAGGLRALMNFVMPLSQLLAILSIYALPRLSGRTKRLGAAGLLKSSLFFPAVTSALMVVYLGALILLAPQLDQLLYGGKMQSYLPWVPLLCGSVFAAGVGNSFSLLLRAVQNSQHQFIAGVMGSAVGVASALLLLKRMGIAGALWSMLAANLTSTFIILGFYLWLLRRRNA